MLSSDLLSSSEDEGEEELLGIEWCGGAKVEQDPTAGAAGSCWLTPCEVHGTTVTPISTAHRMGSWVVKYIGI